MTFRKLLITISFTGYILLLGLSVSAVEPNKIKQIKLDSLYQLYIDNGYDTLYLYQYTSTDGSLDILINEVLAINTIIEADNYGEYDDWIELYNYGDDTVNLNKLNITDDKDYPEKFTFSQDLLILPDSYIILWADNQPEQGSDHLNFGLDSDGDEIYLYSKNDSTYIDSISFGIQLPDVSFGRLRFNVFNLDFFTTPTPNQANPEIGIESIAPDPGSNIESGFFTNSFFLNINNFLAGSNVYYTLDCSEPTTSSLLYSSPIFIDKTTLVRYKTIKEGYLPSHTITQTFLFGTDNKLDVISMVTDSVNLYGSTGIFKYPTNGMEKPIHIEYFGRDKTSKFCMDAGMKMHAPKGYAQKSFRFYARSMYGDNYFKYQFFENKDIDAFKTTILRNAANDGLQTSTTQRTHYRDALSHMVFRKMNPAQNLMSAYKPVSVYIDGAYWGIYNIRERIDKDYIEENTGYKGDMDLLEISLSLEGNRAALEGDFVLYDSIYIFIKNHDLSIQSNYDFVENYIDIMGFTDYWIYEVFIGNFDWLLNNIKIYRPKIPGGKFQWILWDVDHGFGLPFLYGGYNYGDPAWNTLTWSTSIEGIRQANGGSNMHIRGLLQNENYKNYFINRFADLMNEYLNSSFIEPVIDSIYYLLYPEIQKQIDRWGGVSFDNWKISVQTVRDYAIVRPGYVRKHIMSKFELEDTVQVTLTASPDGYGKIRINTIYPDVSDNSWTGIYFKGIPIELEAIPEPGYKFIQWIGIADTAKKVEINLTTDISIEAVFEPILIDSNRIVINEICFKSINGNDQDDWIEITNASGLNADLSNWELRDSTGHAFIFPEDTELKNYKYIIVARNKAVFESQHDNSIKTYGNLPFSLTESNHHLYLYNDSDELIDEVLYYPAYSCADLANGKGFTLELKNPYLENNVMSNWKSSIIVAGTPGEQNTLVPKTMQGLYINELMADNVQTIPDENGEYDDWVEIYNATQNDINIEGMLLTDNMDDWMEYQIPYTDEEDLIVESHGFKLIWLDEDFDQGALHTGFKLSNLGDQIYLYQNTGCEVINLDAVSFAQQLPVYSFGRYIDGVYNWMYLSPTPGESNKMTTSVDEIEDPDISQEIGLFKIYPNPAWDQITVLNNDFKGEAFYVSVINLIGQAVLTSTVFKNEKISISLSNLKPGLYFVRISNDDKTYSEFKKLQIVR